MSKIEVNTVDKASGSTVTVGGSGTNVTLGTSGQTVTIPSGVTIANSGTATGFGSDSDISWQAVVTSNTTTVAGRGYFVDSSGGAITMTLPASPSLGDTVAIVALDGSTNAVTVARNSSNIEGNTADLSLVNNYDAITLVYSDAANGWYRHNNETRGSFVTATGGTATTSGDYKIHTFNSSSNFVVSSIGNGESNPLGGPSTVDYLVVAGGGGGRDDGAASQGGAGGGAGGYRESSGNTGSYTASPLATPTGITVSQQTYPITVGAGGARQSNDGSNSVFSTITSTGGGGGGVYTNTPGNPGGSGGGGGANGGAGGSGNTPPVSPPQGNNGSPAPGGSTPGAGGGAGTAGSGQTGGSGTATAITGSSVTRGGGGASGTPGGSGGPGGGGNRVTAGTANTGGGGGGGNSSCTSKAGGSGVVIIRYKYQ